MSKEGSQANFPATFPLGSGRRATGGRHKRIHTEDSDDSFEDESAEEHNTHLLQDIQTKLINLTTMMLEVNTKLDTHIASCQAGTSVKDLQNQVLSTQQALSKINDTQYKDDKKKKFQ